MDSISPTPRNRLLGQIADAILAADGYAQKPDSVMPMGKANPALALASQFLGIGGLGRTVDRLSYGEPVTNAGKANVPLLPPDTVEAAMAAGPVAKAVGGVAKGAKAVALALADAGAASPLGKTAQRGALRVGGDPRLMPSHETGTENLAQTLNNGTMELYSPSIGVKKDSLMSGFDGSGLNVKLIPKVGAYDPQNSVSTMFNRDAYTPRYGDYAGKISKYTEDIGEGPQEAAKLRLGDRFTASSPEKFKGAETGAHNHHDKLERIYKALGGGDDKIPQAIAIADSPAFRSFEHYENSPLGAKLLEKQPPSYKYAAERAKESAFQGNLSGLTDESMHEIMRAATAQNFGSPKLARTEMEGSLRNLADESPEIEELLYNNPAEKVIDGAIDAGRKLRQGYRRLPSEYGELKVHGPTPLTQENWAGAVMQPVPAYSGGMNATDEKVIQALMDSGISVATPYDAARQLPYGHPLHPFSEGQKATDPAFDIADIMQQQAGPARKQPIRPR